MSLSTVYFQCIIETYLFSGVDSSTKKDVEKMQKWKQVPPDGGWGWLVLLGATLVNVLVPGTVKSFGVLFVEFLEVFDASAAAAAWIPALCYFLYSSLGKYVTKHCEST